jgi:hypothetical protein
VNASVETGGLETRQTQVLTPLGGVPGRTLYYEYGNYLKLGMYR